MLSGSLAVVSASGYG